MYCLFVEILHFDKQNQYCLIPLFERIFQSATIGSGLPPPQSGARFSGANVGLTAFFGIPKDNLATLPNRGFAAFAVIGSFDNSDRRKILCRTFDLQRTMVSGFK